MGIFFIIVPVFILIAIVGGFYSHAQAKKRREELAIFANQMGWQFDESKDSSFDCQYSQFSIFKRGHSRYAYNRISGILTVDDREWPVLLGDYHYRQTSGSGKNRSTKTYQFSFLLVRLPFLRLPDLRIRPEGFMDKFSAMMGWDDINFESAEFSKKFHVTSSDKRFAYDVLDPRMMEFSLRSSPPVIDIAQGYCCFSDGRTRLSADEFKQKINWTKSFYDRWPKHVTASLDDISGSDFSSTGSSGI